MESHAGAESCVNQSQQVCSRVSDRRIEETVLMKLASTLLLAVAVSSCASTVLVQNPPRMALNHEQKIGIVAFETQGSDAPSSEVASRFLEAIHEGQPGVAVVELGSSAEVLSAVGKNRMDGEAMREIGKKFDVDVLIVGALTMKETKPKVDFDLNRGIKLGSVQAQVRLDGNLEAKLVNTDRGATMWSGSSSRSIQLACVSGNSTGSGSVHITDRDGQVQRLVNDMVQEASSDFRPTWVRQPGP
jgi:hypothetical protein